MVIFVAMDWDKTEIELLLKDYFAMLALELKGEKYNKTEFRRNLLEKLPHRKKGAIEFKHQNVSAVMARSGLPYIKGYVPLYHLQQTLADLVTDFLSVNKWLREDFEHFACQSIKSEDLESVNFLKVKKEAPQINTKEKLDKVRVRQVFKQNYLRLEQENKMTGDLGEKFAFEYEIWRLQNSVNPDLAKKVEWVSRYDDGAGFDILSKREDGSDIFIEVKSTKLGKEAPFFFSKNENEFSEKNSADFHLYRVFSLNRNPKLYIQQGRFADFCKVEPVSFKGSF